MAGKKHTLKALEGRLDPISARFLIGSALLEPHIDMGQPYAPQPPCAECGKTPEPFWVPCARCGTHMCSPCQLSMRVCRACRTVTTQADAPTLQTPTTPDSSVPLEADAPAEPNVARCKS